MFNKKMLGARFAAFILATCVLGAEAPGALAADKYPSRPVKIVVNNRPGSTTDSFARLLADALSQNLKGSFIIDNKPGAAGTIGGAMIAKAAPDGYTLGVLLSSSVTTAMVITPNLPYDARKDFTWLANTATNPLVLVVRADSPFKTLEDFVAAAKKSPGAVSAGMTGIGSHSHFNMELLALAIGTKINIVPYSVGTTHMNGLLGGEISSASSVLSSVSSLARAGKIRFLATTSPLKDFPDVPTFASRGYPQVDLEVGFFVVGPAGMPKEVTDVLLPAIEHAVKSAKITTTMDGLGTRVFYGGPKQLADHVGKELDVVTELARKLKLSSDK